MHVPKNIIVLIDVFFDVDSKLKTRFWQSPLSLRYSTLKLSLIFFRQKQGRELYCTYISFFTYAYKSDATPNSPVLRLHPSPSVFRKPRKGMVALRVPQTRDIIITNYIPQYSFVYLAPFLWNMILTPWLGLYLSYP